MAIKINYIKLSYEIENLRSLMPGYIAATKNSRFNLGPSWDYKEIPISLKDAVDIFNSTGYINNSTKSNGSNLSITLVDGDLICVQKGRNYSWFILYKYSKSYKVIITRKKEYIEKHEQSSITKPANKKPKMEITNE